jgi:hypothetical protein
MTVMALRPRNGPELLDAAFQFWRENFTMLYTAVAAAFVPVIILEMLALQFADETGLILLARLGAMVFEALASAAVIVIVSERYMGRSITAGEALARVGKRILTIFATSFLYGFIVGLGIILFIFPGIYWACKYFAMMPAVVIEGLNSSTSQKRSSQLTQGSKRRVFSIVVGAWLIYLALLTVVTGVAQTFFSGLITIVISRVLIGAIYPFVGILVTLLYYDLRIRHEGLDLDLMMAEPAEVRPATA